MDNEIRCIICGGEQDESELIHRGTRNEPKVNVLKCKICGHVYLDSREYNKEDDYKEEQMRKTSYNNQQGEFSKISFEEWKKSSLKDDKRRSETLLNLCLQGKKILDFGCGCGGFIRCLKDNGISADGVELSQEAIQILNQEGHRVFRDISETEDMYDIITMFHVIEHLNEPDVVLKQIKKYLKPNGILICETPNSDDALLSRFQSSAFGDFTYWSEHVNLYSSLNLEKLMKRNGFETKENTQIMRYNLANHLFWLSAGKPGGGSKGIFEEFNEQQLTIEYNNVLIKNQIADTLWYVGINKI